MIAGAIFFTSGQSQGVYDFVSTNHEACSLFGRANQNADCSCVADICVGLSCLDAGRKQEHGAV
jgi:hypothetical protein